MTHRNQNQNEQPSRRRFMLGAWGAATLAALGESALALLKMAQPLPDKGGFGGVVHAGSVDEFEVGTVNYVRAGRFFLVRLEEGFLALWQTCTHLGCSVPWVEEENKFHCPCHSSTYDLAGTVTGGPAPRPMDLFPIEIVEGEIFVDTGNPTSRTEFDTSQVAQV